MRGDSRPGRAATSARAIAVGVLVFAAGLLSWALPAGDPSALPLRALIAVATAVLIYLVSRPSSVSAEFGQRWRAGRQPHAGAEWPTAGRPEASREYLVPRELPPAPALFVGRRQELQLLHRELVKHGAEHPYGDRPFVAVLHGQAGIGKTALALSFAHQISSQFPDGQIFVRVAEWDLASRAAAGEQRLAAGSTDPIAVVARELVQGLKNPGQQVPDFDQRDELIDLAAKLCRDRRLVMVFDDLPGQVDLSPILDAVGYSAVIITAPAPPAGIGGFEFRLGGWCRTGLLGWASRA